MNKLVISVLALQFSLISSYVDFPDTSDTMGIDRWCQQDQDCWDVVSGSNPFVKCTDIGNWGTNNWGRKKRPPHWGKCRIPWDFGTECNTDRDCVRGSTCEALFCHGPSTRGPDPVLRKGLKK